MPGLIIKDGKVGMVRGRVVTDSGGAPCCCDDSGCPCSLANPVVLTRWACPVLIQTPIGGGRLFGRILMRVEWRGSARYEAVGTLETVEANGVGLLCVNADTGQAAALAGSFSRSLHTFSSPDGSFSVPNEYGPEFWYAYVMRQGNTPTRQTAIVFAGAKMSGASFPYDPIFRGSATSPFVGAGSLCNLTNCPPIDQGVFCSVREFADADDGGRAVSTTTIRRPIGNPGAPYSNATLEVTWTRDLTCGVGGEGFVPKLPPGIDHTTLRPYVPGCPGCG